MLIDKIKLYNLFTNDCEVKDFKVIQDTIISSDPEDGGADHKIIIKDLLSGKYYEGCYCDWDIINFEYDEEENKVYRCDFNNDLFEVEPKEITTTIYKRVK